MELARYRLRIARYTIGAAAVGAFAAFGIAARLSHPATHHSTSTSTAVTSDDSATSGDSFDFGGSSSFDDGGSISPSIQSGGS
jgi:hypothetical protein